MDIQNKRTQARYEREKLEQFEKILGYSFKNKKYVIQALTHSSYSNERRAKGDDIICNERLEFLGDSVLSLITSEYIYENFPDMVEGEMSKLRACAVCKESLASYSRMISVGDFLLLGKGEANNDGRNRTSTLENTFEAIVAAIYLDGGFETAKKFVYKFICDKIKTTLEQGETRDYKTLLQQIIQQEQGEILEYVLVAESGPPHMKVFEMEARLNSNVIGRGVGRSKQEAEQLAAKEALQIFGGQAVFEMKE